MNQAELEAMIEEFRARVFDPATYTVSVTFSTILPDDETTGFTSASANGEADLLGYQGPNYKLTTTDNTGIMGTDPIEDLDTETNLLHHFDGDIQDTFRFLTNRGICSHDGEYSTQDPDRCYTTGSETMYSAHFKGFSDDDMVIVGMLMEY
jgi:hypothetical protein